MNPYADRITEADARALVRYMRSLAPADIPAPEIKETAPEIKETAPEINESAPETNDSTPETNDSAEVLQ